MGGTEAPQVKSCLPIPGLTCGRTGASWAFLSCPPEDECANGHHDCNETQNCHDRPHGYECSCKTGYTMDKCGCSQTGGQGGIDGSGAGQTVGWETGEQYRMSCGPKQDERKQPKA